MIFKEIPYFPDEEKLKGATRSEAYAGAPMSKAESIFADDGSLDKNANYLTTKFCAEYSQVANNLREAQDVATALAKDLVPSPALLDAVISKLASMSHDYPDTKALIDQMSKSLRISLENVSSNLALDKFPLTSNLALELITGAASNNGNSKYHRTVLKALLSREPIKDEQACIRHAVETTYMLGEVVMSDGDERKIEFVTRMLCNPKSDITVGKSWESYMRNYSKGLISDNDEVFRQYADSDLFCDWNAKKFLKREDYDIWINARTKGMQKVLSHDQAYQYLADKLYKEITRKQAISSLLHTDPYAISEGKLSDDSPHPQILREQHQAELNALIDAIPDPKLRKAVRRRLAMLGVFYNKNASTAATDIPEGKENEFPYNVLTTRKGRLRTQMYIAYDKAARESKGSMYYIALPGISTGLRAPEIGIAKEGTYDYFVRYIREVLDAQQPGRVLTDLEIATCINWLSQEHVPDDIEQTKENIETRLKLEFHRSLSPRGTRCLVTDPTLTKLGYRSITFSFNKDNKREYLVNVQVGNCVISVLMNRDKVLLDPSTRKPLEYYGAYAKQTKWFEVMILAHLEEIICSEAKDLNIQYGNKTSQERDTEAEFTSRAAHTRVLGHGEKASKRQIELALAEQEWELDKVNKAREARGLTQMTYVTAVDKLPLGERKPPIVYTSGIRMQKVLEK